MKVKELLNHLDGVHELAFFDFDGKCIFSCDSDSIILDEVGEWSVISFKTYVFHRVHGAGLRIVVSRDEPF